MRRTTDNFRSVKCWSRLKDNSESVEDNDLNFICLQWPVSPPVTATQRSGKCPLVSVWASLIIHVSSDQSSFTFHYWRTLTLRLLHCQASVIPFIHKLHRWAPHSSFRDGLFFTFTAQAPHRSFSIAYIFFPLIHTISKRAFWPTTTIRK